MCNVQFNADLALFSSLLLETFVFGQLGHLVLITAIENKISNELLSASVILLIHFPIILLFSYALYSNQPSLYPFYIILRGISNVLTLFCGTFALVWFEFLGFNHWVYTNLLPTLTVELLLGITSQILVSKGRNVLNRYLDNDKRRPSPNSRLYCSTSQNYNTIDRNIPSIVISTDDFTDAANKLAID